MLYSHPDKLLHKHLNNVFKIGDELLKRKYINFKNYDIKDIQLLNKSNLLYHDLGKATKYFQDYLYEAENKIWRNSTCNNELKNHGLLSGVLSFIILLYTSGKLHLGFLSYMIVSRHHTSMQNYNDYFSGISEKSSKHLLKQFESIDKCEFQALLDDIDIDFNFKKYSVNDFQSDVECIGSLKLKKTLKQTLHNPETFLLLNFLFSLLVFSDKLEAICHGKELAFEDYLEDIFSRGDIPSHLVDEYKKTLKPKNKEIACLREQIFNDVQGGVSCLDLDKKILSVNLPTGSGKTLTVLKAALSLRERLKMEKGYNPRIIYVLPFTSVIDQNHTVFKDVIKSEESGILLKHHYMSEKVYKYENVEAKMEEYDENLGEHLVESWDSEIVVSTFVQLLHSVFTNRNSKLKKFHNMAGSIIILDEVQNIPYKYWELVKNIFNSIAEYLNCYFIFMTATMPLIFSEEEKEILELAQNKEIYFKKFDRIKINTGLIESPMVLDEFKLFISGEISRYKDGSFLIVANTIKSSISIYNHICEKFKDEWEVFYLSTNIIPAERVARINLIKEGNKRKIIVSTQMIEAGVDIDIDRVYRDFGPMDSIIQTAGRCKREGGGKKGTVTLVKLIDENNSDKPYSEYVYDRLLLEKSMNVLKNRSIIDENEIFDLAKEYYGHIKSSSGDSSYDLYEDIRTLRYKNAFDPASNKDAFQLIEQEFKTADVFIELDDKACSVWKQYCDIIERYKGFERKSALNKIRKDFYAYVISVPEKAVLKHLDVDDGCITYVSRHMISNVYDLNTGFMRNELADYIC